MNLNVLFLLNEACDYYVTPHVQRSTTVSSTVLLGTDAYVVAGPGNVTVYMYVLVHYVATTFKDFSYLEAYINKYSSLLAAMLPEPLGTPPTTIAFDAAPIGKDGGAILADVNTNTPIYVLPSQIDAKFMEWNPRTTGVTRTHQRSLHENLSPPLKNNRLKGTSLSVEC